MAFWWIYGSNFWLKVDKCNFTVQSLNWCQICCVCELTEATFCRRVLLAFSTCTSAELLRKRCLSFVTRVCSKCVWLNVAGISSEASSAGLKNVKGRRLEGCASTSPGLRGSHLTVIRRSLNLALAPRSLLCFPTIKSLSVSWYNDFIAANPWQGRNKPCKMDLILEFYFSFRFPPHAPLCMALKKQTVISESGTICHICRGLQK